MLAVCMNIIFLNSLLSVFVATLYLGAHIGQMPTFSTIITLSLMAAPFPRSPEENVLLKLTSTMVIAPGEGEVCHLCTTSSAAVPLYFLK